MPEIANPPTALRVRGVAMSLLISAFFGTLWGLAGAAALPGGRQLPAVAAVVAVTAALLAATARLFRLSRRLPGSPSGAEASPFRTRSYRLAVLCEVVAIPPAAAVLNRAGYPGAVVSAAAAIVGLHFFGLITAFGSWRFAAVGGAMVLLGSLSLVLTPGAGGVAPRVAVVGLGCALLLWVGVLPLLVSTWRQAGARPPE